MCVPETQGKSLEEIERKMMGPVRRWVIRELDTIKRFHWRFFLFSFQNVISGQPSSNEFQFVTASRSTPYDRIIFSSDDILARLRIFRKSFKLSMEQCPRNTIIRRFKLIFFFIMTPSTKKTRERKRNSIILNICWENISFWVVRIEQYFNVISEFHK